MTSSPAILAQVPATTSNCGPGFDTLSIALKLYNFVRLKAATGNAEIEAEGADVNERTITMLEGVVEAFSRRLGKQVSGLSFEIWGSLPPARGLGSSATIRAGALAALNEWCDRPFSTHQLTEIATELDHTPDNVAGCFFGGFCVSRVCPDTNRYLGTINFDVNDDLTFVVISPEIEVLTLIAREALPKELPFADAVRSINSASYITAAFSSRRYELLRDAVTDFIHQPYRERLTPYVQEVISAGCDAGAYCGWLSGSGSSSLCVVPSTKAKEVAHAMTQVYTRNGIKSQTFQLKAENRGLTVTRESE